ncbi:MAG: hypothetical protein Q7J85_10535 [Bacillota bacterium]|nr:hypothetical protein [Bacillota bacterium]
MIVKTFYVVLILVFLITGCAAPNLQPPRDEVLNGTGGQLTDETRKVDYTVVDEQNFNPETGELKRETKISWK